MTGHDGYIGAVLGPFLQNEGHDVVGLDTRYYRDCAFGDDTPRGLGPSIATCGTSAPGIWPASTRSCIWRRCPTTRSAISIPNARTGSITARRSTWPASRRRPASSGSCSPRRAASTGRRVPTTFSTSRRRSRRSLPTPNRRCRSSTSCSAWPGMSPSARRSSAMPPCYGVSPRLRGDVVVNNLVGWAVTTGKVVLKSDGSPWRPLVHVEDVCRAFAAILVAPRESIHSQAFNVGRQGENYRIRTVAEMVQRAVAGSEVSFAEGAGADPRCYRVDFSKITGGIRVPTHLERRARHQPVARRVHGHRPHARRSRGGPLLARQIAASPARAGTRGFRPALEGRCVNIACRRARSARLECFTSCARSERLRS